MSKIYSTITKDLSLAVKYITEGRVVAFPTGTSYGLAVNALEGHALQRLCNLKSRPGDKSFTVFMAEEKWSKYLDLTDEERELLEKMKNKPLTLLVKPKSSLEHLAQDGLIGLRVIDHPVMEKLAKETLLPLTATSANKTEVSSCLSVQCIVEAFPGLLPDSQLDEVDAKGASGTTYDLSLAAVLDAGDLPESKSTTIAQIQDGTIRIIRPGVLSKDEIRSGL